MPLPQIMENAQPPRKFDFWNFPSNCAYNNTGLFFDFFALYYRVLYLLLWLCFFWPLENVSIIGAIWPKIKKNPLSGREIFKIFLQIATIIQASFLTFFVMYYGLYLFWFFYTLGKRLNNSRNLTDNFKNYSFWRWNFWNFPSKFDCNTGLSFDFFCHVIIVYICVCFFTTPCHNFLVINFFGVYVIMPQWLLKCPPTGHESSVIDDIFCLKDGDIVSGVILLLLFWENTHGSHGRIFE